MLCGTIAGLLARGAPAFLAAAAGAAAHLARAPGRCPPAGDVLERSRCLIARAVVTVCIRGQTAGPGMGQTPLQLVTEHDGRALRHGPCPMPGTVTRTGSAGRLRRGAHACSPRQGYHGR